MLVDAYTLSKALIPPTIGTCHHRSRKVHWKPHQQACKAARIPRKQRRRRRPSSKRMLASGALLNVSKRRCLSMHARVLLACSAHGNGAWAVPPAQAHDGLLDGILLHVL